MNTKMYDEADKRADSLLMSWTREVERGTDPKELVAQMHIAISLAISDAYQAGVKEAWI